MIAVVDIDGFRRYLAAGAIARVTEAGPSARQHGINAYIRTFDNHIIEVRQTAEEIAAALDAVTAEAVAPHGRDAEREVMTPDGPPDPAWLSGAGCKRSAVRVRRYLTPAEEGRSSRRGYR